MQDSMMIAEVGDMLKVSGNRMATPFAPPSPGRTPMMTPSTMPTSITRMLKGCKTTAKPWNRLAISSMTLALAYQGQGCIRSEMEQIFDWSLRKRKKKPLLEHHVKCDRHADR